MNTNIQRFFLITSLAGSLLLPACGSKNQVKSQNASEMVLNPQTTPGADGSVIPSDEKSKGSAHSYVEKVGASNPAPAANNPAPIAVNPILPSTPVSEPIQSKSGSHWVLWVLGLVALGGIGWVYWSKQQSEDSAQPMPPVGGLSPVSGFTAVKDKIEEEASSSKVSFWSKKIF